MVFFTDMIDPPFFEKVQKLHRVFIPNAVVTDLRQRVCQFFVQCTMIFQIGVAAFFKKILFNLEMDAGVFGNHADHGPEHLIAMLVLYCETKGIDGGNNSPVLLINNRYSQIVRWFPDNKNIVIQQTLPGFMFSYCIGQIFPHIFRINILLPPVKRMTLRQTHERKMYIKVRIDRPGEGKAEITVTNMSDMVEAEKGHIAEKDIRSVTIKALVDTGAATLIINDEICRQLGLGTAATRSANPAGGGTGTCKITESVQIQWITSSGRG
jgi:hypothetical protein